MDRDRWINLGAVILIVVVAGGVIAWLRATAPAPTSDVSVQGLPIGEPISCEELTADEPGTGEVPGGVSAGVAKSGDILSCPFAFDGLLVTYVGEVVGDVLQRDGGSWVLVNDDAYALETGPLTAGGQPSGTNSGLTVWLPDPLDELVDEPGRHDVRGDVIEVVGRVVRADPADGGGLTIRAEDVDLLADAAVIDVPVHWRQVIVAVVLSVLALLTLARERARGRE